MHDAPSDAKPSSSPMEHPPLPESERTIVRPRPGARAAGASGPLPASPARPGGPSPAAHVAGAAAEPLDLAVLHVGANRLLALAQPLLTVVTQIRAMPAHPDPAALKEQLTREIAAFEREAAAAGVPRERIVAARYVLCTLLDEAAAGTPWGGAGSWARDSLLVRFHNETWGGEKVFQLLAKLAQSPAEHRDLLELIYVCIALGFEGRYRIIDNGRAQLEQLRERLHQLLRQAQPAPERALSPHWQPAAVQARQGIGATPVWAFCAVLALAALLLYGVYAYRLGVLSDPMFARIQSIPTVLGPPTEITDSPPPAPPSNLPSLLEPEVREGLVSVRTEAGRHVITLRGDGLFEPGSAAITPRARPVFDRIAAALQQHPGRILISGHSDNQPIRTPRFPSNWHLSQERARAVEQLLAARLPSSRLHSEGRADAEPIAPNDSPAGRARNRRVDLTLVPATVAPETAAGTSATPQPATPPPLPAR